MSAWTQHNAVGTMHVAATRTCPKRSIRPSGRRFKISACASSTVTETSISSGKLSVQYLAPGDVQGAGLLLTRAFAGTPEAVRLDEAVKFMQDHTSPEGEETTLVARLVPTDPALLPPGRSSRLVGCVSLSFSAAAREEFVSLAPPGDEVYLSNMAVDPKFRRQGIARAMLAACDAAAAARGKPAIWLHVRQADAPAQQLYSGYGYQEVDRDKGMMGLFALGAKAARPRILMKRQLQQQGL